MLSVKPKNRIRWPKWWEVRRKLVLLKPKRTCTDCGFLAFGDAEADSASRTMIRMEGKCGLPGQVGKWRCARNIWDWEMHYVEANWDAVFSEANFDRRSCRGFFRHSPGRSPREHFQLEDGRLDFRRKLVYTSVGALLGALLGWFIGRR